MDEKQNDLELIKRREKEKEIVRKIIVYFFLGVWALMVLFPFYWMILTSLKSQGAYVSETVPKFFTLRPTINNYLFAFNKVESGANLLKYLVNTVIFAVITTALMLIITVLAAFAFARLEFKGKNIVFTIFLSLMMIPCELVVITNFVTIKNAHLNNTFAGLILPSVASIFYIYLLKENFSQIPDNLYYAAKVDGTSDLKYLFKVMIPISKPTIVSIIILKIIECWNSYVWPRAITDDPDYFLVSNGIQQIRESGKGMQNIPGMMAAVVVVSIPLLILFLIFKHQIMTGVSKSGTKG